MKKFIVFDNGGKTHDRFTIINKETGDVFAASENPYDSKGVGSHVGNCASHKIVLHGAGWRQKLPLKKVIQAEVENYVNNAKLDPDWIGKETGSKSLPEGVRKYIAELDAQDSAGHQTKANNTHVEKHPKQHADSIAH
jgi:hypothetical protein